MTVQHSKIADCRGCIDLSPVSDQGKVGLNNAEDHTIGKRHTSAAPTHDCPRDRHFSSSTSGKYNGSGMRAGINAKAM